MNRYLVTHKMQDAGACRACFIRIGTTHQVEHEIAGYAADSINGEITLHFETLSHAELYRISRDAINSHMTLIDQWGRIAFDGLTGSTVNISPARHSLTLQILPESV